MLNTITKIDLGVDFMKICIGLLVVLAGLPAFGFAGGSSYDCVDTGNTNIGWSGQVGKYTAEAFPRVAKPSIVKISGLDTEKPFLTGQSVTRLVRVAADGATIWMLEQAAAGAIIGWTFFSKSAGSGPPTAVLVSTKSYDLFGPVSFTTLYVCTPNDPLSQKR
jgi:hypothetical protein